MASQDSSTESPLKRIYESGEWSDLTISTATRDFRVHKNIVCPACPFFDAACTGDFREAHTGVVKLPESAETVEGILRYIYGLPVGHATVEHAAAPNIDHLRECIDLHVISDKYDLPGLRTITKRSIITYLRCVDTASKLVDAGFYIHEHEPGTIDDSVMTHLATITAKNLHTIREHEVAWQKLISHEGYLTAAMSLILRSTKWTPLTATIRFGGDEEEERDFVRVYNGLRTYGSL
ncbi:hypothetical protein CERZMDRAFT_83862 [Cercospora zeae-maydis SCOH1-5]|uniref:BTB domain-containing protein n=1 Tax=Cercospora zeae-maydis SCOH1-5 TaxID=717836 RepID=A0A6A6FJW6_9PEZI|nr:hypothetical protein CERZMDRAFT_83862 [Cercospora zeae-maydis SCOH1-5]